MQLSETDTLPFPLHTFSTYNCLRQMYSHFSLHSFLIHSLYLITQQHMRSFTVSWEYLLILWSYTIEHVLSQPYSYFYISRDDLRASSSLRLPLTSFPLLASDQTLATPLTFGHFATDLEVLQMGTIV
jgi:hypothetical protein